MEAGNGEGYARAPVVSRGAKQQNPAKLLQRLKDGRAFQAETMKVVQEVILKETPKNKIAEIVHNNGNYISKQRDTSTSRERYQVNLSTDGPKLNPSQSIVTSTQQDQNRLAKENNGSLALARRQQTDPLHVLAGLEQHQDYEHSLRHE